MKGLNSFSYIRFISIIFYTQNVKSSKSHVISLRAENFDIFDDLNIVQSTERLEFFFLYLRLCACVCVRVHVRVRLCACVCACAFLRVRLCMCVCACDARQPTRAAVHPGLVPGSEILFFCFSEKKDYKGLKSTHADTSKTRNNGGCGRLITICQTFFTSMKSMPELFTDPLKTVFVQNEMVTRFQ